MDSNKVFVAMWFDKCVDGAYYQGIGPAIRAAGYNPVRIDNIEHTGQIEDAILAEIHKSKFIVADLTEGHAGTRGAYISRRGLPSAWDSQLFTLAEETSSIWFILTPIIRPKSYGVTMQT